ncbi:hypothetical protein ACWGNE_02010 [Streptomyces xiamenensis]|uniref:hypothetical protein n=1 Tax=Streptomyces xiamenensis TaxID=408015 RepID=UPI003D726E3F
MTVASIAFPVLAGLCFLAFGCCIVFNIKGLADRMNAKRYGKLKGDPSLRFLVNVKIQGFVWIVLSLGLISASLLAYFEVIEMAS